MGRDSQWLALEAAAAVWRAAAPARGRVARGFALFPLPPPRAPATPREASHKTSQDKIFFIGRPFPVHLTRCSA